MKCPKCQESLVMSDRQGIEIDYCPQCRGVWLDRGELDKIIERSTRQEAEPQRRGHEDDDEYHGLRGSRRKAWWTELFD